MGYYSWCLWTFGCSNRMRLSGNVLLVFWLSYLNLKPQGLKANARSECSRPSMPDNNCLQNVQQGLCMGLMMMVIVMTGMTAKIMLMKNKQQDAATGVSLATLKPSQQKAQSGELREITSLIPSANQCDG